MKKLALLLVSILITSNAFCGEKISTYPTDCKTASEKTEYCYILQEKLRAEHNAKGADYRNGVITKAQWDAYLKDSFEPKQRTISRSILEQKDLLKQSTKWSPSTADIQ